VTLDDVGFGDVFLCSGQSNMEDPVLTTMSRNESYAEAATGALDHIRLFQMGWRFQRKSPTWILPQAPDDDQGCVAPISSSSRMPPALTTETEAPRFSSSHATTRTDHRN
jgi:hypothetical protein